MLVKNHYCSECLATHRFHYAEGRILGEQCQKELFMFTKLPQVDLLDEGPEAQEKLIGELRAMDCEAKAGDQEIKAPIIKSRDVGTMVVRTPKKYEFHLPKEHVEALDKFKKYSKEAIQVEDPDVESPATQWVGAAKVAVVGDLETGKELVQAIKDLK